MHWKNRAEECEQITPEKLLRLQRVQLLKYVIMVTMASKITAILHLKMGLNLPYPAIMSVPQMEEAFLMVPQVL